MKTLSIDPKNNELKREFKNSELEKVVEIAKNKGYKVFTFRGSNPSKYISQVFFEDLNGRIGTCQSYYSGIQFSTVHKSKNGSGNGTGFGGLVKNEEFNQPENIDICFISYPYWMNGNGSSIYKYTSFQDYLNKGLGILTYYEI